MGHRYRHFTAATSNDLTIQPTLGRDKRHQWNTAGSEARRSRKPGHPPPTDHQRDRHTPKPVDQG